MIIWRVRLQLFIVIFLLTIVNTGCSGSVAADDLFQPVTGNIVSTWVKTPFTAIPADTPEAWMGEFPRQPRNNEGILFRYTQSKYHLIHGNKLPFTADIIYISRSNSIIFLIENCTSHSLISNPEPASAALCMPAGYIKKNKVQLTQYVEFPGKYRVSKPENNARKSAQEKIDILQNHLENYPQDAATRFSLSSMLLEISDIDNCLATIEPLINLPAISADVFNTKAKAVALSGQFQDAIELFSQSLNLEPHRYSTVYFIERTLQFTQSADTRISYLNQLVKQHPNNIHLLRILIRTYLEHNNIDTARNLIEKKLIEIPDNPDLMKIAGNIFLRAGDKQLAADAFLKYIQAKPYDPHLRDISSFVTVHTLRKQLLEKLPNE